MTVLFSLLTVMAVSGGVAASVAWIGPGGDLPPNPPPGTSAERADQMPGSIATIATGPVSDALRVQRNKLYGAGRLAAVDCEEPTVRPSTKAAVLRYYQAVLPCLNRAWAPLVRRAGYEFRAPKLVLFETSSPTKCGGTSDLAFYCGDDETITMRWRNDVKNYRRHRLFTRVDMMETVAHEYGHHIQLLTHIMTSSNAREGRAKDQTAKLAETRRLELQASCFGAAFLGANKSSLGLSGHKLEVWRFQARHSGDEYSPTKVRDHGSRKNNWYWTEPAFRSASPKSCNTFTAPTSKVS